LKITTRRFGALEITDDDIVRLPEGLVGLSRLKRFVLIQDPDSPDLYWLQNVEEPDFTLAAIPAAKLGGSYAPELPKAELDGLGITDARLATVLVIVNRVAGEFYANLRGPVVIHPDDMRGKQIVLNDPKYSVRHLLQPVSPEMATAGERYRAGIVASA
jgi:flagellar assembly factor FliW